MRTITYDTFGEPSDVLRTAEVETPQPGPGEVLLRLVISPIHNHDLWTIRGTYGVKPELPSGAGSEGLAVVEALGEGVTSPAVGTRVHVSRPGLWAEQFTAAADSVLPVPDALSDEAASQLVAMPFSALSLLEQLALEPGEVLIQNAANGAVGRLVAQFARARGYEVVGLVRRSEGVEELAAQGITGVVATDQEDWEQQARELIGDKRAVAGIDSVGGEAAGQVLTLLSDGGKLVVFGAMAAPTMALPSGPIIFRDLHVEGFWGAVVSTTMPADQRKRLITEIIERLVAGEVTLPIGEVFTLDQAREASAANFEAGRSGKVMLRP